MAAVRARKSFWPLDVDNVMKIEQALRDDGAVIFIGHPGEKLGAIAPKGMFEKAQELPEQARVMHPKTKHFERDGFVYVEVTCEREPTANSLKSFEGMSGGGFWRVHLHRNGNDNPAKIVTRSYLLGTVFWQGSEIASRRIVRAHGPKSIYEVLLPRLRDAI